MHGIIFSQLRKYVETKQGSRAWSTLLKRAQLENRAYLSVSEYPDAEMDALILRGHPKAANEGHLKTGQRR